MDILSQLKLAENIVQTDRQKHDQAFEIYYETAQNSNDKYASYRLGKCYDKAIFVKADKEKAIEQYTISAKAGYVEAQYNLGMLFMMRDSSNDENRKNAIKWYEKAASQNHVKAKFWLAHCLNKDNDTVNKNRALQLYFEAANQGLPIAQVTIAEFYSEGYESNGLTKDPNEAASWYMKAAAQGEMYPSAYEHLAYCYSMGRGVRRSEEKAREYYLRAFDVYMKQALAGSTTAMMNVAMMYRYGKGVEKDIRQADQWDSKWRNPTSKEVYRDEDFYQDILRDLSLAFRRKSRRLYYTT